MTVSPLEWMLGEIADSLQLTQTMHESAVSKYETVSKWLEESDSPFAPLTPEIYPQGSMALGTTVRPLGRDEYDLDLVLHLGHTTSASAATLYEALHDRLAQHGDLRHRIERLKRCIRLEYADEFHLDIIPGRPDLIRGGNAIEVPDRKLQDYVPSNPRDYVAWFEQRAAGGRMIRDAESVPDLEDTDRKSELKKVVQLIKRARDIAFQEDEERAPRSIVLTTLAAIAYSGTETSLHGGLVDVLDRIVAGIKAAKPRMIEVRNPTNEAELFSEKFSEGANYAAFEMWIEGLTLAIHRLVERSGLDELGADLERLFGPTTTQRALRAYGSHVRTAGETGRLRTAATGLIVGASEGRPVPQHRFYGDE